MVDQPLIDVAKTPSVFVGSQHVSAVEASFIGMSFRELAEQYNAGEVPIPAVDYDQVEDLLLGWAVTDGLARAVAFRQLTSGAVIPQDRVS